MTLNYLYFGAPTTHNMFFSFLFMSFPMKPGFQAWAWGHVRVPGLGNHEGMGDIPQVCRPRERFAPATLYATLSTTIGRQGEELVGTKRGATWGVWNVSGCSESNEAA